MLRCCFCPTDEDWDDEGEGEDEDKKQEMASKVIERKRKVEATNQHSRFNWNLSLLFTLHYSSSVKRFFDAFHFSSSMVSKERLRYSHHRHKSKVDYPWLHGMDKGQHLYLQNRGKLHHDESHLLWIKGNTDWTIWSVGKMGESTMVKREMIKGKRREK